MTKIFKYEFGPNLNSYVTMPWHSQILTVGVQNGKYFVWALVDEQQKNCSRKIMIYGTGWDIDFDEFSSSGNGYIGTIFDKGFVWHIFDGGEYDDGASSKSD